MNIFKPTTFTWWQIGLLKWAVLLIGVAIGATWSDILTAYVPLMLAVGLLLSVYLLVVWSRNK
jgi:hypothetical protein